MPSSPWSPEQALTPEQAALARAAGPCLGDWGLLLAGGTALSCHLGHRRSRDLDWFGPVPETATILRVFPGAVVERDEHQPGRHVILRCPGTKVELVGATMRHEGKVEILPGVAIPALEECAAMKMAAAINRGRRRDLVDVAFLLRHGYTAASLCDLVVARFPGRIARVDCIKRFLLFRTRPLWDGQAPVDLIVPEDVDGLVTFAESAFARLMP